MHTLSHFRPQIDRLLPLFTRRCHFSSERMPLRNRFFSMDLEVSARVCSCISSMYIGYTLVEATNLGKREKLFAKVPVMICMASGSWIQIGVGGITGPAIMTTIGIATLMRAVLGNKKREGS